MRNSWSLKKIDKILKKEFKGKLRSSFYKKYLGVTGFLKKNRKSVNELFNKYCLPKYSSKKRRWKEEEIEAEFKKHKCFSSLVSTKKGLSIYRSAIYNKNLKLYNKHFKTMNIGTSVGEETTRSFIQNIFKKKFTKVRHPEIINPKTLRKLELDGFNKKLNIAFEYGSHEKLKYSKDYLSYLKKLDFFKNKRCKQLGIKLIKIKDIPISKNSEFLLKKQIFDEFKRLNIKTPKPLNLVKFSFVFPEKKYKYNEKDIWAIVKKCKDKSEFSRKFSGVERSSKRIGIYSEIVVWFNKIRKQKYKRVPHGYWNEKTIRIVAKKCKKRSEFSKKYCAAYNLAINLGILNDVCNHMKSQYPLKK